MRLAVATTSYPRRAGDYAGAFVRDLNVGLRRAGAETLTFAPDAVDVADLPDDDGGPVVRVVHADARDRALFYGDGMEANARRLGLAATARAAIRFGRRLASAVRARGPFDAVLAHWLAPTAVALAGRVPAPVFGVCHGGDAHLLARPCVGRGVAALLRGRVAGVLAVSETAAETARRRLGVEGPRLRVGPMGIDAAAFAPRADDPPREPGLVVAAGRLVPIKGFALLVAAVARLRAEGRPLRLLILGEGPERARLVDAARADGVPLELPGVADRAVVAAAFRRAALVAVPSLRLPGGRTEGAPVVAVEALAAGAAVIGSATGGLPELLRPGALHRAGDVADLARAARFASDHPDACRDVAAAARFDRNVVGAEVLAWLRRLLPDASSDDGRSGRPKAM